MRSIFRNGFTHVNRNAIADARSIARDPETLSAEMSKAMLLSGPSESLRFSYFRLFLIHDQTFRISSEGDPRGNQPNVQMVHLGSP